MNWCILIPLLVGAICALLGYLLGRLLGGGKDNDCEDRLAKLQAELDACLASKKDIDVSGYTSKISSLEADLAACKASLSTPTPVTNVSSFAAGAATSAIAFDGGAAKLVYGKKIKQDDLTVVEGIGPKISGLFNNFDVKTWKDLSECTVDKCQEVLDSGGERYKIHNPGTWPRQAKLAYEGKWEELKKWQDSLDGGKE